jgi:transportin-3
MRYPPDLTNFSAQDRDEFRDFRHDIGDVLKDCVQILGEEQVLQVPYNMLQSFFQALQSNPSAPLQWQEVEAPLFSLRAMCREVSLKESKFIPDIMSMLPQLPEHPKIQYAAILVIGRYAQWTREHPDMLTYQLDFVSKGFQGDKETTIAAAHTFRDLCKYCSKHLVKYMEELQPFYVHSLPLVQEQDRKELSEAVSHLLAAVPKQNLSQALNLFCSPVGQRIHLLLNPPIPEGDREKIMELNASIDELGTLFKFIDSAFEPEEHHPILLLLEQMWPIIDNLFQYHGHRPATTECLSRFFRNVLESTKVHFAPLLSRLMTLLLESLQKTKLSCFVWVGAKIILIFGSQSRFQKDILDFTEGIAQLVFQMVQETLSSSQEPEIGNHVIT